MHNSPRNGHLSPPAYVALRKKDSDRLDYLVSHAKVLPLVSHQLSHSQPIEFLLYNLKLHQLD